MPQSLSSILIHATFSTKDREPLINPDIERELFPYMATILHTAQSPALIIGGTSDHVHLLFSLSRTKAVADVIADVKADSSKWIKGKGAPCVKFYWQTGYGAFSIGQSNVETLRRYIALQREHHRKRTFQDEFRELLGRYRVPYDERYVWD